MLKRVKFVVKFVLKFVMIGIFGLTSSAQAALRGEPIWIFSQWHVAPGLEVKPQVVLPQAENQTAIFRQLEDLIRALPPESPAVVFAEGCEGEIDERYTGKFNGWGLKELSALSPDALAQLPTHIPMRLESRFGKRLQTLCVDDLAQIRAGLLAFSDARGAIGYASRIRQWVNDPVRLKPYLSDVQALYKLPARTTPHQALNRIQQELKSIIRRIENSIAARNRKMADAMARTLRAQQPGFAALVIGGAHTKDLVSRLDKAGLKSQVVRPKGYSDDAEKLVEELKQAVQEIPLH